MSQQSAPALLMIRPANFGYNYETAESNAFQIADNRDEKEIADLAKHEFDQVIKLFETHHIKVLVFEDTSEPKKTDAVFPNNWISLHQQGELFIYPMLSPNRRLEKRREVIEFLDEHGYDIRHVFNLSGYEDSQQFLEGTGSIIFDYVNMVAYANRSARTSEHIFLEVCKELGYEPIIFDAYDRNGKEIYHTNVLMCIGSEFVIICAEAVPLDQRKMLYEQFERSGHEIIKINFDQMEAFAGNMMELQSTEGKRYLAMSYTAYNSLENDQVKRIQKHADILHADIPTIEKYGGGSLRCMMTGIFLPNKK